jgi:hypothetical protein
MPRKTRYDFFVSEEGFVSFFQAKAQEVLFPRGLKPQNNAAILKLFEKRLGCLRSAAGAKHMHIDALAEKLRGLVQHMTHIIQGRAKPDPEWGGDARHELLEALEDFGEIYEEVGRINWLIILIRKRKKNLHTNVFYGFHNDKSLCYSGTTKSAKLRR